jgi:carbonic anhydrase
VKAQVGNVCKSSAVTAAWAANGTTGKPLWVHGWVFEIENGKLRDLGVSQGSPRKESGDAVEVLNG